MTLLAPRYSHPFTLEEATLFDVGIINEEIARLQNSLRHLRTTQAELEEYMSDDIDGELTKAYAENKDVIGAQEERISILEHALRQKGVQSVAHYNTTDSENGRDKTSMRGTENTNEVDEGGIDL